MGEMAEWGFDNNLDLLIRHDNGECDEGCPYCEDEWVDFGGES